jgi:hypothetical protein
MILDFDLPAEALKIMVDSITDQSNTNSSDFYNKEILNIAIPELAEEKIVKKLSDEASDEMSGKLIDNLFKTFFITDINLKWNQPTRSFINQGEFGVRSMDKYLIERKLQGRIEIKKGRTTDEIVIYLQQNNGSWYYLKYLKGNMNVLSSDMVFNEAIKKGADKVSGDGYTLRQASISDRNKLLRAMKLK